ncbi:HAL5 [Candida margitis]|uniref:HAL5 n=1 Tax=Candida margitis TaxID=1775924 RepID=UPI00222765DB|nr:HAL5 [Candida margitis]KAI5968638.1 HAL5 [Candida margitis]
MGLFSKKKSPPPSTSSKSAATPTGALSSNKSDLALSSSNESIKSDVSSGKIKGLLKKTLNGGGGGGANASANASANGNGNGNGNGNNNVDKLCVDLQQAKLDKQIENNSLQVPHGQKGDAHLAPDGHIPTRYKKRVSTIIETDNNTSDDDSEDEEDEDNGEGNESSDSDESELDEDHLHPIKPKYDASHHDLAQQLTTIMGYCGLRKDSSCSTEEANKESQRTYSLLDQDNKIKKIAKSVHNDESIIGEYQIQLIKNLTAKIERLVKDCNSERLLTKEKSLYQRYGVIRNVIGKGAYGLIKVIDPDGNKVSSSSSSNNLPPLGRKLYVVKELSRRKDEKTNNFIERIMSEFVISSTLNSKYMIETVDLMGTFAPGSSAGTSTASVATSAKDLRISQVMNCSQGGDLFSYLLTGANIRGKPVTYMSLYEVDCILKQVARGLKYMHAHGVAHCDLKLENILISYEVDNNDIKAADAELQSSSQCKMSIKLSDFGKSFVFRTAFDKTEQKLQGMQGVIGSEPYISPEEYLCCKTGMSYSSVRKDCWAFGIVALALLNIRRHYYYSQSSTYSGAYRSGSKLIAGNDSDGYSTGYLWKNTETKVNNINASGSSLSMGAILSKLEYKDKVFNEYVQKRMIGDYDCKSKEWLIKQPGKFIPIENICKPMTNNDGLSDDENSHEENGKEREKEKAVETFDEGNDDDDEDDLSELRILIIYKLLDIDPATRMTMDQFLKSDWMAATESCC